MSKILLEYHDNSHKWSDRIRSSISIICPLVALHNMYIIYYVCYIMLYACYTILYWKTGYLSQFKKLATATQTILYENVFFIMEHFD